jgi:hypothetical protein
MDALSINAQIRHYELRIMDFEQENAKLNDKVNRLNEAEHGYQEKQSSYYNYISNEQAQANRVKTVSHIRIAESYADSILSLCSSSKNLNADDAFVNIQTIIQDARRRVVDEIRANSISIGNIRLEIGYLRNRLYSLS